MVLPQVRLSSSLEYDYYEYDDVTEVDHSSPIVLGGPLVLGDSTLLEFDYFDNGDYDDYEYDRGTEVVVHHSPTFLVLGGTLQPCCR